MAKVLSARKQKCVEERIAAVERIRKLARGLSLGGLKIKNLIAEGRR